MAERKALFITPALVLAMTLAIFGHIGAATSPGGSGFGFKAGLISSATFSIDSLRTVGNDKVESTTKIGLSTGMFFDVALSSRIAISPGINLYDINVMGHRQWMIEVGAGLKYTLQADRSRVALRPAIEVGYGYLADFEPMDKTEWFVWKVQTEIIFLVDRKHSYVIEASVIGFENGRNDEIKINTNPVISARVGVIY